MLLSQLVREKCTSCGAGGLAWCTGAEARRSLRLRAHLYELERDGGFHSSCLDSADVWQCLVCPAFGVSF